MASITLNSLLEAGAHFGHQTKRWNPKMKRFILCPRNGIYIIDLNKTITCVDTFIETVKKEATKGGKVLFVGTKKQVRDCIKDEAIRCNMPYITYRWLGGMLTNFQTIRQSLNKLEKFEAMEANGTLDALPKKEALKIMKKKEKLLLVLDGVRNLKKSPSLVFIVDSTKEHIAVSEARRLKIPIAAIVDTNADPDEIDFPIPANDDAIKSVQLITRTIADAILESTNSAPVKKIKDDDSATVDIIESEGSSNDSEDSKSENAPRKKRRVLRKKNESDKPAK